MNMNDAPSDQLQRSPDASTAERPPYPIYKGGMLRFLWSNTDVDSLSDAELHWLSCGTEDMNLAALNLEKTLEGVAALIQTEIDLHDEGKIISGAFQPHGLPEFLHGMSQTAAAIRESLVVSGDAETVLRYRWEKRARQLGFNDATNEEKSNG